MRRAAKHPPIIPSTQRIAYRHASSASTAKFALSLTLSLISSPVTPAQDTPRTDQRPTQPAPLRLANALLSEQRYEVAAEEFERFLATQPAQADRADALYGLARAQLFQRRYPEARQTLEQFLRLAPEHPAAPSALFRLGEAAYLMRDLRAAKQALERFVVAYPDHAQQQVAWPYLGSALFELGEYSAAQNALDKTLSSFPNSPLADRARYTLARALAAQNLPEQAIEQLKLLVAKPKSEWADRAAIQIGQVQLAAGKPEDALGSFQRLEANLPAGPLQTDVQLRSADALLQMKRLDEAEAILLKIRETAQPSRSARAQLALTLGAVYTEKGDHSRAFTAWDLGANEAADSPLAPALLFRSAEALEKLGKPSEARARFETLTRSFPDDEWADDATLNAARIALDAKDYPAAQTLANHLKNSFPKSDLVAEATLIEGRSAQLQGKLEDAIQTFESLDERAEIPSELRQSALQFLSQAYRANNQPAKADATLARLADTATQQLAAGALFTLGQSQFDARQFDLAIKSFQTFLKSHPDDELVPHALSYVLFAAKELEREAETQAALEELIQNWPKSEALARVRLKLGEAALDDKHFDEAIALFEPVANGELQPWAPRACLDLGWALLGSQRYDAAADAFQRCAELGPDSAEAPDATFLHAWALEQARNSDGAINAYKLTADAYPKHPVALRARLAQARLLDRLDRHAEAAEIYQSVIREHPNALPEGESIERVLLQLARAYRASGQHDQAEATLSRVIDQHPETLSAFTARVQLAESAFRAQDYDRATALLTPVASDSNAPAAERKRAQFRLGRIALETNDLDAARQLFSGLLTNEPDGELTAESRFWHAETLFRAGDAAAAEHEFAALELADDNPAVTYAPWRDSAKLRRLQCLVTLKRWSDVEAQADKFLEAAPQFPQIAEVYYARGRAFASQAPPRFEAARASYQAAIDAAPRTEVAAKAQFMRGESFLHERNHREAIREFHQVELLYAYPHWQALALLELGKTYEALARSADAAASYKKLLDKFPDDPNTADARARLTKLSP